MAWLGFGRSQIRYDMFDLERSAEEARRAQKVENLYHRGQDLAWDGREVLRDLLAKHGGVKLDAATRDALGEVFAVIMWGELAAWRISLQLADRLVELEPKMAATSQAHDEARHFYVMYDYLREIGYLPGRMNRSAQALLDLVLETDDLAEKLLGMQLMVEAMALTIFQAVREKRIEPVLADLLLYYEKDEARHVGLGVQWLPSLMKRMSKLEAASLFVFQMRIVAWTIAGLKALEPSFDKLDIDPRDIIRLGRAKQTIAFNELAAHMGIKGTPKPREYVIRVVNAINEVVFPRGDAAAPVWKKLYRGWREDLDEGMAETSLHPDEPKQRVTSATG